MAELVQASGRLHAVGAAQIVAMCLAVATLEGFDIQAIGIAGPKMVPALGLAQDQAGWVFSSSMIGLVMGAVVGGRLADRVGRKPILLTAIIAFAVFSLLTVLATSYYELVAVRIATGLGLGGAIPNLIAIAAEISPRHRRTITTTLISAGMPTGGAVASLYAIALPNFEWQTIFLIGGVLPLLLLPVIWLRMPETKPGQPRGTVMPPQTSLTTALFGEGRASATLLLWLSFALTLIVLYLLLNWLPTLAVAKGLGKQTGSMAALTYNLGSIPGALFLGVVVDRYGLRRPMIIAYAALVAVMLGMSVTATSVGLVTLAAAAGFLCVGGQYVLYAAASNYYPARIRGTGAGAAVAVGRFGSIAGPIIAGDLFAAGATANQVIALTAPIALAAGIATLLLTVFGRAHAD